MFKGYECGRASLPNEYRIQMTTVRSPLSLNPNGLTVLLGYEQDSGVFAGFDFRRHRTFTEGSASVQTDLPIVRAAIQSGLSFHRKSNAEIAVGVRPDQLLAYVLHAEELHRYGADAVTHDFLEQAASLQIVQVDDLSGLSEPRRRIVRTVSTLARIANFRQQVVFAYGQRCAVTRAQLRLVDAAHILPVGAPGSTDDVRNGLALAPTYHRAFDNGLIFLDQHMHMRINSVKVHELAALNLAGGLQEFSRFLGKILLPPDRSQWPNPILIKKANEFRRINAA